MTSNKPEIGNDEGRDGVGVVEIAKKLGKSKGQKLSEFQKSVKSGKNLSKSWNSPNFDVKDDGLSFLTPKERVAFNCLWLAFTKAPIF